MQTDIAKSVPIELESSLFMNINSEPLTNQESYCPTLDENRDSSGRINSISYYDNDNELEKQIFYEGSNIVAIKHYSNNILKKHEKYKEGLLHSKTIYNKIGTFLYNISYEYGIFDKLTSIKKSINGHEIGIKYDYDSLGRIIRRTSFLDNTAISFQEYCYDVLNNIVNYKDDNQEILIIKFDNNRLISYSITDKIGNVSYITNHFVKSLYTDTELVTNGQKSIIKNFNYVDNVMLKKPRANEEDLDLIVSKLFSKNDLSTSREDITNSVEINAQRIIDENIKIKIKTLPISIRKRVLYNIAQKANT